PFRIDSDRATGVDSHAERQDRIEREIRHAVAEGLAASKPKTGKHLHEWNPAGCDDTRVGCTEHVTPRLGPVPIIGCADAHARDDGGVEPGSVFGIGSDMSERPRPTLRSKPSSSCMSSWRRPATRHPVAEKRTPTSQRCHGAYATPRCGMAAGGLNPKCAPPSKMESFSGSLSLRCLAASSSASDARTTL